MDLGLHDKVALVLGAGGGLGQATAVALAAEGAVIAAADINERALARTGELLQSRAAPRWHAVEWDLADLAGIDAHITDVETTLGPVDVLVNITGGPPPGPISDLQPEVLDAHVKSMVTPLIAIATRVLPGMRNRHWGRIITSTSSGVLAPIPNLGVSNTLRAALHGWSKTLAREVGSDGVTANVIVPGRIDTDRIRYLDQAQARREHRDVADIMQQSASAIPLQRYGRPEEFAAAVAFLASDQASYITGSVLRVDGGLIPSV